MKGKLGLIVGIGVGYVLGTRAGRERYEQIKEAAAKVWELDPVQAQVARVSAFARSSAIAVPKTLFQGAVKVGQAVIAEGSASTRAQRGLAATEAAVEEVADDFRDAAAEGSSAAKAAVKPARKTTTRKSTTGTTKAKPSSSASRTTKKD